MGQAVLRIERLPDGALEAAAVFHTDWLPRARALLAPPPVGEELVLVFPVAAYDHRGWRLAAIQDLAREAAPKRVNAIVCDDEEAITATAEWLARAPGITGQLLAVSPG
jgi:hypothetical protein